MSLRSLVITTEWNQFRNLDLIKIKRLLKSLILLNLRNLYEPSQVKSLGFLYVGVGRKKFNVHVLNILSLRGERSDEAVSYTYAWIIID